MFTLNSLYPITVFFGIATFDTFILCVASPTVSISFSESTSVLRNDLAIDLTGFAARSPIIGTVPNANAPVFNIAE